MSKTHLFDVKFHPLVKALQECHSSHKRHSRAQQMLACLARRVGAWWVAAEPRDDGSAGVPHTSRADAQD